MKKVFTLSLALVVVLSLTLLAVACGGEETTTDDSTVTSVEDVTTTVVEDLIPADAISWEDAELVEDEVATVYGEVMEITDAFALISVPKILVRVGGTEENPPYFNVVVGTDDQGVPNVPGVTMDDINGWVGKTVVVTGTVVINPYEATPTWEIVIVDGSDVVVAE